MKIKNGFISNSSSSSFIIDKWDLYDYETGKEWTKRTIKQEIKNIFKRWIKSRLNNIVRDTIRYRKQISMIIDDTDLDSLKSIVEDKRNYYKSINLNRFNKEIKVGTVDDIDPLVAKSGSGSLSYWYAGKDLEEGNLVIFDADNYLPYEVNKLIAKRFKIPQERYNWHMG